MGGDGEVMVRIRMNDIYIKVKRVVRNFQKIKLSKNLKIFC